MSQSAPGLPLKRESAGPQTLGARSIRGLGEIFAGTGMKGRFVVIPSDLRVHAEIYTGLEAQGHEIGLHMHPTVQGDDFIYRRSNPDYAWLHCRWCHGPGH